MARSDCEHLEIVIIGNDPQAGGLFTALSELGHPVYMRAFSSVAAYTIMAPQVVFVTGFDPDQDWRAIDRVHDFWSDAAIVVVGDHVTNDLEDQAATRSFVSLRMTTQNLEEFHALAHHLLAARPDTRPLALEA